MKFENKFNATPNGHNYAIDLVEQIQSMNHAKYLDADIINGQESDFCFS